jgi:hypothetical protein
VSERRWKVKIKKTVSDKVIAANRRNAQRSTGPKNIAAIKYNAVSHGLLVKGVVFRTDEEENEFHQLWTQFEEDLAPANALEQLFAEEIVTTIWKLRVALRWELDDIRIRQMDCHELLHRFSTNFPEGRVSLLSDDVVEEGSPRRAEGSGWHCGEVVLKTGAHNRNAFAEQFSEKDDGPEFEIRLTSAIETILRYQASLKRDLYRAVQVLQSLKSTKAESPTKNQKNSERSVTDNSAKQSH